MNLSLGRLIKEKDYIYVQLIQLMSEFKLHSPFKPAGDQPQAINELTDGILAGDRFQTLLFLIMITINQRHISLLKINSSKKIYA